MSENIHKDCENYNSKKDYCLKFFEANVSENYKVCKEYSEFSDKELSRKWSNWIVNIVTVTVTAQSSIVDVTK